MKAPRASRQVDLFADLGHIPAVRPPVVRAYLGDDVIYADSFCGGGGASEGGRMAFGRGPDIACNHDPLAIAFHSANHKDTRHFLESVYKVDPVEVCGGKRVALAWFSPDCRDHSQAKGGKPVDRKIRGLAWIAVTWAQRVAPDVIAIENVIDWTGWGPCIVINGKLQRDPARKGQTFRAFVRKLERLGYVVEWRVLRAHDFGAPTKRRRVYLVARRDGKPIAWPTPTHGPGRLPYRTAAEFLDFTIPVPSIFDRKTPLAQPTLNRIAEGIRRYVLEDEQPFIVPGGVGFLIHRSNGERPGQTPRTYDIREPLGTICAQGEKHSLVVAFLEKAFGSRKTGGWNGGASLRAPLGTITTQDHHRLVACLLIKYYGAPAGQHQSVTEPLDTITTVDRFGPVTVQIDGETYRIVDIGLRMLTARELFLCQGFRADYDIAPIGPNGKRISKKAQVRMVGNSVSPPPAAALLAANFAEAA